MQLQEVQKSAQTSDSSARELQLEAQLAEARCIIDEQVCWHLGTVMLGSNFRIVHMYSVQDDQQQLSASLEFYNDSLACEPTHYSVHKSRVRAVDSWGQGGFVILVNGNLKLLNLHN